MEVDEVDAVPDESQNGYGKDGPQSSPRASPSPGWGLAFWREKRKGKDR